MNTILYKGEQYLVYTVRRYSQPMELELTRVFCVPSRYPDGTLAVTLRREESPHEVFAVITRNLSGMQDAVQPQPFQAYLDTKGCTGWLLPFLLENALADTCMHCVNTAFDSVPLWQFRTEKFFASGLPADLSLLEEFALDIPQPPVEDMPVPPPMEEIPLPDIGDMPEETCMTPDIFGPPDDAWTEF